MTPPDEEALAQSFEDLRPHLLRVAYSTTGSLAEAEDCVQESWLRLRRVAVEEIRDLRAWLTTTVGRLALDSLRSARVQREAYVGPWLPEPVVDEMGGGDPAERIVFEDAINMALLVVLERLSPAERTAFLLHDVFGLGFEEVARVVDRTPAATRQLAARARRHVEAGQPRFPPTRGEQQELVGAFAAACEHGDLDRLLVLLDPEVAWHGDGGGKVASVPLMRGAANVADRLLAFTRVPPRSIRLVDVNGAPGIVMHDAYGGLNVLSFTIDGGRIVALDIVRNPDKLHGVT
ncbi:MAG: RNA polymerase sigma factor SigJ [Candidatus Dormiibacterota bacterium]